MPAFTDAEIESSSPDAWTGKSTSLVYESEATVAAWLTARGHDEFSGLDEDGKKEKLLLATEEAENWLQRRFLGREVSEDQGLLFPSYGAYDNRARLIPSDTAPDRYLRGIRLIAEKMAAGTWMRSADSSLSAIKSEGTGTGRIVYRDEVDLNSIAHNHPDVFALIREARPRNI